MIGHNEDMKGPCTEMEPSPPNNPCMWHPSMIVLYIQCYHRSAFKSIDECWFEHSARAHSAYAAGFPRRPLSRMFIARLHRVPASRNGRFEYIQPAHTKVGKGYSTMCSDRYASHTQGPSPPCREALCCENVHKKGRVVHTVVAECA